MMCPGCGEAADRALAETGSADHDPFDCSFIDCTCQHARGVVPHV